MQVKSIADSAILLTCIKRLCLENIFLCLLLSDRFRQDLLYMDYMYMDISMIMTNYVVKLM